MNVTIHHTTDGTPYARPYMGRSPVTGTPIRPYREFPGMTDAQALAAAEQWVSGMEDDLDEQDTTVGDMLKRHIDMLAAGGASPSTIRTYAGHATNHARPIARRRVSEVTPLMLDNLFYNLMTKGARGGRPLSQGTVLHFKWFLSGAFRRMVQLGVIDANPVTPTMRISPQRKEAMSLDADEARRLTAFARDILAAGAEPDGGARWNATAALAILIALHAGLRIGECCALRNCDLITDDESGRSSLRVSGTVISQGGARRKDKTKGGRPRVVSISSSLSGTIGQYQAMTKTVRAKNAPLLTVNGNWIHPTTLLSKCKEIMAAAEMPRGATFHTLRHTHATTLLTRGIDAKTVAERLGHADVATTLRIYGHALPAADERAAETAADAMGM